MVEAARTDSSAASAFFNTVVKTGWMLRPQGQLELGGV